METRIGVARVWDKLEENREMLVKEHKLPLIFNRVAIVNNTVARTADLKYSHHKKTSCNY